MPGEDELSWESIGTIAEIIGALAVIVSLAYVGFQIRQNTLAIRASSIDSGIQKGSELRYPIIENAEVARIYYEGSRNIEALGEEEKMRYRLLLHNAANALMNLYFQTSYGGLSAEIWDAQQPTVMRVLNSPGGRWFWEQSRHEFPSGFRAEVDRIIAS